VKTKRTKRQKAAKQPRTTLAKRIKGAPDMFRKLEIAQGKNVRKIDEIVKQSFVSPSDENLFALMDEAHSFHDEREIRNRCKKVDPNWVLAMARVFWELLGNEVANAIENRDYKMFARLAAILQFNREPEPRKLYVDILDFCTDVVGTRGTEQNPCDPWQLLAHLKNHGHGFTHTHENQLPRTLHALCKKLGVHLLAKRPGRPRKNPQR